MLTYWQMIERASILKRMNVALTRSCVVVLTGPRQCGKTTLARQLLSEDSVNYFDLEKPSDLARLDEPMTSLERLRGLVVIDEVQRRPDLFPLLRVLCDRRDTPARFLILGSASGDLLRQTSESLAGRAEMISIGGFTIDELGFEAEPRLWLRGGLPPSLLAATEEDSIAWRSGFVQTLLERDFPQWGVRIPAVTLLRFWTMLAHCHGQVWKAADPARALGVSEHTARRYLDLMTSALMVRQLQPYFANIGKRQVKAPKIYVKDSGLLHQLLGIGTLRELFSHPKVGLSWEGFVIEQVLLTQKHDEAFFWGTHQGAEIDLIVRRGSELFGVECKRTDAPRLTASMRIALDDLGLSSVVVLHPGSKRFPIVDRVEAVPFATLATRESLFAGRAS